MKALALPLADRPRDGLWHLERLRWFTGRQGAVCEQSTGSVCARQARARPPAQAASPPAPGHACHRGPQATSAWDKRRVEVPRAPCLHSCRCEDRHGGGGGGHSPQQEGPRASGKCFPGWGPRGPSYRRRTEARGQSRNSFTAQQNRAPLTWQTHLQSAP